MSNKINHAKLNRNHLPTGWKYPNLIHLPEAKVYLLIRMCSKPVISIWDKYKDAKRQKETDCSHQCLKHHYIIKMKKSTAKKITNMSKLKISGYAKWLIDNRPHL